MAQMSVRMTDEELNTVRERAKAIGMSLNSYAREVLKEAQIEIKVKQRTVEARKDTV